MKLLTLRGLAVLALLVLAPLRAATIVQTAEMTQASRFGSVYDDTQESGSLYFVTPFQLFNPAQGTLTGVTFRSVSNTAVTSYENNVWPHDIRYDPMASVATTGYIFSGGNILPLALPVYGFGSAPSQTIAGSAAGNLSSTPVTMNVTTIFDASLSGASMLPFVGSGLTEAYVTNRWRADSFAGGASASGNTTVTLTYHYGVPDHGAASAWLALALAGLFAVRHIRARPACRR